ncbi:GDSL esterase/lipase, partial [Striga asiatica]
MNYLDMDFAFLFCVVRSYILIMLIGASAGANNTTCLFQSLYQFGDSISDTGNLVRIPPFGPFLPAARQPYGRTFPGKPTGRWSDGRLIIDFTAASVGLPPLNPYLKKYASFENGVNFAVAGATALNMSFFTSKGIIVPLSVGSLARQLT